MKQSYTFNSVAAVLVWRLQLPMPVSTRLLSIGSSLNSQSSDLVQAVERHKRKKSKSAKALHWCILLPSLSISPQPLPLRTYPRTVAVPPSCQMHSPAAAVSPRGRSTTTKPNPALAHKTVRPSPVNPRYRSPTEIYMPCRMIVIVLARMMNLVTYGD